MSEHFIKNIEIDNFKCFNSFKAEGFKRVNLIGGKNNVGKTAFMEACYINVETNSSLALMEIIEGRYLSDFFGELVKEVGFKYIVNLIEKKSKKFNDAFISSNLKKLNILYEKDNINEEKQKNIFYMDSYRTGSEDLDILYAEILENRLESKIDMALNKFDNNLDSFRIMNSEAKCSVVNGSFRNVNEFGDGVYRYITYLCIFYSIKKGIIFIDEIENGIHYTKFDEMWKMILQLSEENDVQVFATTHSKECIESYVKISKELEDEDTTYIKITKLKNNTIIAGVRDYNMLQDIIDEAHEVRGW